MEPDKKLYFIDHDNEEREIDGRNIVHIWPKLNVVRRINFGDSDVDANKNTKKKKRSPPKKRNDRIRFLQNLKQEIDNAKYDTLKETESRYGTRSSVKKRSQQSKGLTSPAPTATEIPKLDDEDIIENSAESKISTEKGSLDSMNIQGEADFKHVANIKLTLKQNQTLQLNIHDHKTPAKLYIQTENIERPVTRSMTKKSPKNEDTSQLLTSEDIQLDRIESEVQKTDPEMKAVSPRENVLETNNLLNVTDKIIQDSMTCESLQDKILYKSPQNLHDEVRLTVSPFNIDMQEELDNQPVLQDQEFTDYIHEEFQRMEIGSEVQTQHQIVSAQKDGNCSSSSEYIDQNYTQVVEAIIHGHKPVEPCVENNIEITQQHHLAISEDSVPKTTQNALDNDAQSTQPSSPLQLTDFKNIQEVKVELLRHSSYLDYLGILPISDATSQLTHTKNTTLITHAVATTDEVDLKHIETITPLVNSPERKVTMLKHIATEDYKKVGNIGDDISQGQHEKIIKPKSQSIEISNTNLEPIQQLSVAITEKQRTSKVMKKKDFFNKENKLLSKFPYEKQVKITDSQVIFSAAQTGPSLTPINPIIPREDLTQEEDISSPRRNKIKRKENKVLSTLQKVNLNDIISVKPSKTRKTELKPNPDLDRTQAFEDLSSNNTKKSKQAQTKLKCEGTEHTRYKKQPQKIKVEKMKKVQKKIEINTKTELMHDRMVTRNRKKQTDANKLTKIEKKELRIVITPTITETCVSEQYSDKQNTNNNQESNLYAIDILEETINSDNPKDAQIKAETDTYFLRKNDGKKKYIDFLSDNEDFEWSSSSWEGSCESDSKNEENANKKKKKKIKKQKQNLDDCENTEKADMGILDLSTKKKRRNKRVDRQSSKEKGEEYMTRKGNFIPGKFIKENPCNRDNCFNDCFNISEERRRNLFRHYWSQSSARKRDWLIGNSDKRNVKRQRAQGLSRRTGTFMYFINEGEGKRQICLKFLLKTLDLRQKFVYNTISCSHLGSSKEDLRGRHVPLNKTSVELTDALKLYLTNLPVLPSHYCRKKTTKLYLPEGFRNLSNTYRMYKETQRSEGRTAVSQKVFREVFKRDFNYGFHVPRKDKCVQCLKFENDKSAEMQEIQKSHIKDKEETYNRFKAHQNIYLKDKSILCVSFDLQKVLNTPFGKSILLFYYRKLSVYNFTFYECGSKEGHCYTWNEVEGKRGANEISSILKLYIQKIDDMGTIRHLLFYSDCCPGQNRNKIVISCVQNCLKQCKNLDTIQLNYLLPGHTYMPVDSMHSVIEKSVKNTTVWTPSQWAMVFNLARKNPKPYHVNVMTHNDFMDWDSLVSKDYQKILSGKIGKLRTVTFKRSAPDTLFIKYSMHPEAKTEIINTPKLKQTEPKKAYKSKLPISKKKQEDFNKMCSMNIIPEIYHNDYLNLHYTNTVEDVLEDTDVEDLPEV